MSNHEKETYIEIYTYLLNFNKFTKKDYQELCKKFGKDKISGFINNISEIVEETKINDFLTKYEVLIEEEYELPDNNIDDKKSKNAYLNANVSLRNLDLHVRQMREFELLTPEKEKELFIKLKKLKEKLKILKSNEKSVPIIDFPTIFMSIKDEGQIKSLLKLYKASYMPKNTDIYEKTINSKNDREIIKKYLEMYDATNKPLTIETLIANFKSINFDKYTIIQEQEFDSQISALIDYFNIKKDIAYANLRLSLANAGKLQNKKMELDDINQETTLGLLTAIDRFEVSKGTKLSTYATYWIRQTATRAIKNQGDLIRIPIHKIEQVINYKKCCDILSKKLNRKPTIVEIAEELNISTEECLEFEKLELEPTSLDARVGEKEDTELSEFISSDEFTYEESVEEIAAKKMRDISVEKVLETALSEKEADVIRKRFGIGNYEIMTLEEIGKKYGVTRERIRQIEIRALSKLQNPKIKKLLKDYL